MYVGACITWNLYRLWSCSPQNKRRSNYSMAIHILEYDIYMATHKARTMFFLLIENQQRKHEKYLTNIITNLLQTLAFGLQWHAIISPPIMTYCTLRTAYSDSKQDIWRNPNLNGKFLFSNLFRKLSSSKMNWGHVFIILKIIITTYFKPI